MAKIGDHVSTSYGNGTVISGKKVRIHGKEDKVISYADDKRAILGVIKTRLQIEKESTIIHKKYLKSLEEPKPKVVKEKLEPKLVRKRPSSSEKPSSPKSKAKKKVIIPDFMLEDEDY